MDSKQALLKRNPSTSPEEFSANWLRHGALAAPWFLSYGYSYYAQIHAPLQSPNPNLQSELSTWDGAAESTPGAETPMFTLEEEAWRTDYYLDVILEDEKRFLVSEALNHLKFVDGVTGTKRVIIQDGKAVVEIPESVWEVWRSYEARGKTSK